MIGPDELAGLLPDYLPRQRWFAGDSVPEAVTIEAFEVLRAEVPMLLWALVRDAADGAIYQVVVGVRPLAQTEAFLEGKGRGFLGDLDGDGDGPYLAYDALVDPELAVELLRAVAPEEGVVGMRPLTVEQSNTSVVFDDRLILKLFRRVHDEGNPDAEVVEGLARVGFTGTARPVATWRREGRDLAVVREFLVGGSDGWDLARTSLRDLYDRRLPPEECGGDFAFESERLGVTTAALHLALADAFGHEPGDPEAWARALLAGLDEVDVEGAAALYRRLGEVRAPGASIRVHGDLHLGQVLRTNDGWFVLDFEGEPRLAVEQRRAPSSPLRDVAGMLRSFHYASQVVLRERHEVADEQLVALGDQWVARNRATFLDGYLAVDGIEDLLPGGTDRELVLRAFELGKAVYEVGYERAHRPDWESIPAAAIGQLLAP